jgi:hypothetical protein
MLYHLDRLVLELHWKTFAIQTRTLLDYAKMLKLLVVVILCLAIVQAQRPSFPPEVDKKFLSMEHLIRYNYHFSMINSHCSKGTIGTGHGFCQYASEIEYLLNAFTTEMHNRDFKNHLILDSLYRAMNIYLTREYLFEKQLSALNITL